MTKGIREFVNARFAEHLPQRAELTNAGFRKKVMEAAIVQFNISVASAATHYNHALKMQRQSDPKSVEDLGRAEDKKGGRKPIHTVDVIKVKTGEVVAQGLSKAAADAMIEQAASKKKAKLAIKEVVIPAEPETAPEAAVDPEVAAALLLNAAETAPADEVAPAAVEAATA